MAAERRGTEGQANLKCTRSFPFFFEYTHFPFQKEPGLRGSSLTNKTKEPFVNPNDFQTDLIGELRPRET